MELRLDVKSGKCTRVLAKSGSGELLEIATRGRVAEDRVSGDW